nr:immunoglobulin light chain junction region [Macaca mulatta]
CMQGIQFPFTV